MKNEFDYTELDLYTERMMVLANRVFPQETKKFMRDEGTKLKRTTVKNARSKVKKKENYYFKSIKKGKPYKYSGALAIRTYTYDPKAHLLEDGHRQVVNPGKGKGNGKGVKPGKGIGREVGFVPGKHIFEEARREFSPEFTRDCENFVEEITDKL